MSLIFAKIQEEEKSEMHSIAMGVFQFFASGNVQRIEIRWNNMLPFQRRSP